jgi:quinol monooxygenase YgiN
MRDMIKEIADIEVTPGHEHAFEAAVQEAAPLFKRSAGCRAFKLERVIEAPSRYHLVVMWDSVQHHMEHFRASPAFQEWRRLVSPHWVGAPSVHHTEIVVDGFGFPL